MIKKSLVCISLLLIVAGFSQPLFAQGLPGPAEPGPFGIGIMVGEPSGIVAKLWLSRFISVDGAFAWSFVEGGFFYTHLDLQYSIYNVLENQNLRIPLYVGAGGRLRFGGQDVTDSILGIRFPVGAVFIFRQLPIDLFVEVAPGIDLIPDTDFFLSGGLGARYYF